MQIFLTFHDTMTLHTLDDVKQALYINTTCITGSLQCLSDIETTGLPLLPLYNTSCIIITSLPSQCNIANIVITGLQLQPRCNIVNITARIITTGLPLQSLCNIVRVIITGLYHTLSRLSSQCVHLPTDSILITGLPLQHLITTIFTGLSSQCDHVYVRAMFCSVFSIRQ